MKPEILTAEFESRHSTTTEIDLLTTTAFELQKFDLRSEVIKLIDSNSFICDPIDFYQSLNTSNHLLMLTMYSIEQLATMRLFKLHDFNIGFALKDFEDSCEIVAVHNNEAIIKNIGKKLIEAAIRNGGNTLDHFGSRKLNELYESMGFVEYAREPYNSDYDPDSEFQKRYGRLPVIYRKLVRS
jgi:hypothetical protein